MNLKEMMKNSLRYPFTDIKKFIFLGIFILISSVISNEAGTIPIIYIFGALIGLFVVGYIFRVMKLSLNDVTSELPEFNLWVEMFLDGLKVVSVSLVYAISCYRLP
jgi:uncharacterized membrane protein YjfL (UPF0719 family)